MNQLQSLAFAAVWYGVIVAQTYLLLVLVRRKAFRDYPAFSSFVAFCVVRSFILYYVAHTHGALYQPVKWIAYVPQLAILLAVVLEVLYLLFHPFNALPTKTLPHFVQATAAVAVLATGFAILHPGAQPTAWMTFARAMDQVVSWVLCSVFVFVALFSKYFGIPWRHRVFGIGVGFLLYLSVDVAVTTAVAQLKLPPYSLVWLLDMLAFLVACILWIYYFHAEEIARSVPTCEQIEKIRTVLGDFGNFLEDPELRGTRNRQK